MRKIEVVLSDERLIKPSGLCMVRQSKSKFTIITAVCQVGDMG